jgi:hypothetical protein
MSATLPNPIATVPAEHIEQNLDQEDSEKKTPNPKQHEIEAALPVLGRVQDAEADAPTIVFPIISTYKAIVLVGLVMISAMMQVASGIGVSITIADIGHDLKIPSGQLQWVASAGSLATACTLLVSGKLADMYGHKSVFVIGCTLGGAFFLGMGLARDKYQLFIFRALGGVAFSGYVANRAQLVRLYCKSAKLRAYMVLQCHTCRHRSDRYHLPRRSCEVKSIRRSGSWCSGGNSHWACLGWSYHSVHCSRMEDILLYLCWVVVRSRGRGCFRCSRQPDPTRKKRTHIQGARLDWRCPLRGLNFLHRLSSRRRRKCASGLEDSFHLDHPRWGSSRFCSLHPLGETA